MKRILPFLVRFVVISLLFVPLLPLFHRSYRFVLAFLSTGAVPTGEAMESPLAYDGSGYLSTFCVLILATPGVAWKKRGLAVVTGILLFLFDDFFMTVIWPAWLRTDRPSLANMAVSYGWLVVTHYLLPFLLWFAFTFRELDQLFRGGAEN